MMMHCEPATYGHQIFYTFFFGASISFSDQKKLRCLPCSSAGPLEASLLQMESMGPMHNWTEKFLFLFLFLPLLGKYYSIYAPLLACLY